MNRKFTYTILSLIALLGTATAGDVGVVNFGTCIADSKMGKQEQASFEALKKQMTGVLEDTEKKLQEISVKLNDPEYLDGLSPEGEDKLKMEFRQLSEEMQRHQNQYYQVLNQANMKIVQAVGTHINNAAEKVAKEKKLTVIVNKDACFFYSPQLEVTSLVVAEMDKNFKQEEDAKK